MKKKKDQRNQSVHLKPIEDCLDLATLGCIDRDGWRIGFYILGGNNKNTDLSKLVIKFGFECQGIHPLQRSESQYEIINRNLTKGFKEITDATVTFRWSSFSDFEDLTCSKETQERLSNPISKESYYFDIAANSRKQELAKKNAVRA
jgi:hypothetical protein